MTKRLILGVLLAAVALFLAACGVEEEEAEDGEDTLGRESGASATAEPTVLAATPEPASEAATPEAQQGLLGCPDCVKAGDQLRVTAEDIQPGPDGKYYVPDRGDGCVYHQTYRGPDPLRGSLEEVLIWADGCEVGWHYYPTTGQLIPVIR